jgi:predicted transcriptional regulator of viral defense system
LHVLSRFYGVEGLASSVKIKLGLDRVVSVLAGTGKRYVTVRDLSLLLGVSTKTAGRLMSRLEDEGFVRRYSNKAFKLMVTPRRFNSGEL